MPADLWILDVMRTDPRRSCSSRWLANRTDCIWTLPKISERLRILSQRGVLIRLQQHGRGYLYKLAA